MLHLVDELPRDLQVLVYSFAHGEGRMRAIREARVAAARVIVACWTRHRFVRRGYRGYPIVL
jgi:hypothetical protein